MNIIIVDVVIKYLLFGMLDSADYSPNIPELYCLIYLLSVFTLFKFSVFLLCTPSKITYSCLYLVSAQTLGERSHVIAPRATRNGPLCAHMVSVLMPCPHATLRVPSHPNDSWDQQQ